MNAYATRAHAKQIVLTRSRNCCEGSPKYPDCRAEGGYEHPATGKPTTIAVIAIEPGSEDPAQMRAFCDRCLLAYDFQRHKTQDWRQDRAATGNLELFPIEGGK